MDHDQMMSPDTVSSLFPDRPIRPLPRRRLRERLSPEVANSIKYPPSTLDNIPLFYYPPYTLKEESAGYPNGERTGLFELARRASPPLFQDLRNGAQPAAGDEDAGGLRNTLFATSPPAALDRAGCTSSRPDQPRSAEPQPPPSATSSVDGYESFENNNKKKRKIPSASDSVLNGTHSLNGDIGSLAISASPHSPTHDAGDRLHASAGYPANGPYVSSTPGFSGSGRGRLGRSRNGRSPLRALADGNGTWPGRPSKVGAPQWPQAPEGQGIISSAIAHAEKLPPQGQENVSLLEQHSALSKTTPASTQFTFTCDSQVPGTVQWPGQSDRHGMANQAMASAHGAPNAADQDAAPKAAGSKSDGARRKSGRRLERELNMAARHRKQVTAELNYHQPPRADDVWICEFCEYESIFGEPPRALIRDYEIKDRRLRQEEADRKRLLEKAKAKSRKGRKSVKAAGKGGQGTPHSPDDRQLDPLDGEHGAPPMHHGQSHSTQSEGNGYVNEVDGRPSPPPGSREAVAGDGVAKAIPLHPKT